MKRILVVIAAGLFLFAFVQSAVAAPAVTGEFDLNGATPGQLAQGPDGFIYVVLSGSADDIARVSPDGAVTYINSASINNAVGITSGPDNNLWVTQANGVVKFTPSATPTVQAFTINAISDPRGIVSGPDNFLWTASADKVVKFDPNNPLGFQEFNGVVTGARGITASTDGLLWIADFGGQRIVSVTTAGVGTPYNVGGGPQEVGAGPGGQVLYANPGSNPQTIGRLVSGGSALTTDTPQVDPFGIRYANDGAYWIAQFATHNLGRITPDGQYTTFPGLSPLSGPRYLTLGPSNTLWVSLETAKKVARVSGVEPPAALTPAISRLKLTPSAFKVGKRATPVTVAAKRRYKTGTTISFNLSTAANLELVFNRILPGKRKGKKCVRPTKPLKRAKRCRRYRLAGKLTRGGVAGANKFKFSGRIGKRALKPGAYQLVVRATAPGGTAVASRTKTFRIVSSR